MGDTLTFRVRCILLVRVMHSPYDQSLTTQFTGFTVARKEKAMVEAGAVASRPKTAPDIIAASLSAFIAASYLARRENDPREIGSARITIPCSVGCQLVYGYLELCFVPSDPCLRYKDHPFCRHTETANGHDRIWIHSRASVDLASPTRACYRFKTENVAGSLERNDAWGLMDLPKPARIEPIDMNPLGS